MQKRFEALDSWRGVCAASMLLYHFPDVYHGADLALINGFYLFVDFFFVLSGFVITHSYQNFIKTSADVPRFLALRLGRIYPLHVVSIVVCLAAFAIINVTDYFTGGVISGVANPELLNFINPREITSDLLLLQAMHVNDGLHLNYPSWSISAEFYVYVLFAVLALGGRHAMAATMAIAAVGGPIFIAFAHGNMDTTFDYGFLRCLAGFACGYWLYQCAPILEARREFISGARATVIEVAAVTLLLVFVGSVGKTPWSVLCPYVFVVIVAVFYLEGGAVSRTLKAKPFLRLGALSFSIYLMHAPFIYLFEAGIGVLAKQGLIDRTQQSFGGDVLFVVFASFVFFAARWSYAHVEMPYKYTLYNALERYRAKDGQAKSAQ